MTGALLSLSPNARLSLRDLTIDGNKGAVTNAEEALIHARPSSHLTLLDDTTIQNNSNIYSGGGVRVAGGTFLMKGGLITDNESIRGGGVDLSSSGVFTMEGGEINNNEVTSNSEGGGGVYAGVGCAFSMSNGTIQGNTAKDGDGVYLNVSATGVMSGGVISGNTVTQGGGGVYLFDATFTMEGGAVSGNSASGGDGIFSNEVRIVHFDQSGAWGQTIEVAAKVNLTELDTENLYFYSYDKASNSYKQIASPNDWVDANGYLHFTTELAGDIIINKGALTPKGQNNR